MGIARERLILLGICALYERAEVATIEPMKPDFAIRAVLALLHGLGCDRSCTDGYWQEMRVEVPPIQGEYIRATAMRTQLERIKRSLRVAGPLFEHELATTMRRKDRDPPALVK